jgi:hypothetical protein
MTDSFFDFHQISQIGDMSEHTINGDMVSTGIKNGFSQDYFSADGTHEWAVPDGAGATDVHHGTSLYEKVVPHGHGVNDVYDSDMHLKATVAPNVHGGHDVTQNGTLIESSMPLGHGSFSILNYSDPLSHLSEYGMSKLVLE